jgi:hypothetical protein
VPKRGRWVRPVEEVRLWEVVLKVVSWRRAMGVRSAA